MLSSALDGFVNLTLTLAIVAKFLSLCFTRLLLTAGEEVSQSLWNVISVRHKENSDSIHLLINFYRQTKERSDVELNNLQKKISPVSQLHKFTYLSVGILFDQIHFFYHCWDWRDGHFKEFIVWTFLVTTGTFFVIAGNLFPSTCLTPILLPLPGSNFGRTFI